MDSWAGKRLLGRELPSREAVGATRSVVGAVRAVATALGAACAGLGAETVIEVWVAELPAGEESLAACGGYNNGFCVLGLGFFF